VAFHTGNLVPGIEVTNDPLMQARLFSYLDTQLTRLGGPNFSQLPINRPHCPVNDMLRDGMHQTAVHTGVVAYKPNGIDADAPLEATAEEGGYVHLARPVEGVTVRANPVSFDDHFSQPALFYRSLSPVEQAHVVEAFTFELGKVYEQTIRERELQVLANVDADLCARVAAGLGLPAPAGDPIGDVELSPALSQVVTAPGPIAGRKIGVIADSGSDLAGIAKLRTAATKLGATVHVIAPIGGVLKKGRRTEIVERSFATVRSIEFDALVVAGGTTVTNDIKLVILLQEAYRHCKAVAAWGDGTAVLEAAGIPADGPGVSAGEGVDKTFTAELVTALGLHRAWERADQVMASAVAPAPGNTHRGPAGTAPGRLPAGGLAVPGARLQSSSCATPCTYRSSTPWPTRKWWPGSRPRPNPRAGTASSSGTTCATGRPSSRSPTPGSRWPRWRP